MLFIFQPGAKGGASKKELGNLGVSSLRMTHRKTKVMNLYLHLSQLNLYLHLSQLCSLFLKIGRLAAASNFEHCAPTWWGQQSLFLGLRQSVSSRTHVLAQR